MTLACLVLMCLYSNYSPLARGPSSNKKIITVLLCVCVVVGPALRRLAVQRRACASRVRTDGGVRSVPGRDRVFQLHLTASRTTACFPAVARGRWSVSDRRFRPRGGA